MENTLSLFKGCYFPVFLLEEWGKFFLVSQYLRNSREILLVKFTTMWDSPKTTNPMKVTHTLFHTHPPEIVKIIMYLFLPVYGSRKFCSRWALFVILCNSLFLQISECQFGLCYPLSEGDSQFLKNFSCKNGIENCQAFSCQCWNYNPVDFNFWNIVLPFIRYLVDWFFKHLGYVFALPS